MSKKNEVVKQDEINPMEIEFEKPDDLQEWENPENISLADIGSVIEGVFLGLSPVVNANGDELIIAYFKGEDGKVKSCVASYQIKNFLIDTDFPVGAYLRIEKVGEKDIGSGRKMGQFKFQYSQSQVQAKQLMLMKPKQLLPVPQEIDNKELPY